jgi:Uma2 family endonuclease
MSTATMPMKKARPRSFAWLPDAMLDLPDGRSLSVDGVSWSLYDDLLRLRDANRRSLKLRYDDGDLDIMTKSNTHEQLKKLVAFIIEELVEVMDVPMLGMGETTVAREDLAAGFEPDEWYYIGDKVTRLVGTSPIDFGIHPPPDLTVEIEVSRTVAERLPLFARIGVAEVWCCGPGHFEILRLNPQRDDYLPVSRSQFFPAVPKAGISGFFAGLETEHYTALKRRVRTWAAQFAFLESQS